MNARPAKLSAKHVSAAAADWVARRAAGLSSEDQRELDHWLSADPRHRSAFDHHANAFATFDRPRAMHQIPQFVQEVEKRARRRQRRRIQVAAACVAAIFLMAAGWRSDWRSIEVASARGNVVIHKPETRVLPDGSSVELKTGAEIAVNFSDALRRVTLHKGSAHFQVATDSLRPFVVLAEGVETRAVGTAFSVQLENAEVEVIVTHGRVAVGRPEPKTLPSASKPAPLATIDAGRRLVLNLADKANSPAIDVLPADELAERLAWRSPRLEFTDTPLAEAVALMNREASGSGTAPPRRLVIDSSSRNLSEEPVTGFFRADNTEAFVRMMEITLGLQSEKQTGEIVLYRKR